MASVAPINYFTQAPGEMVPKADNPWFKQLNSRLGTELRVIAGTYAQYIDKFQVLVASGSLPEVMQIPTLPQLPKLLESKFTDLTPYLSGDNIKRFPGLAATPTAAWDVSALNGKIWGTLNSRVPSPPVMAVRGDALQRAGLDPNKPLASGDEFIAMLQALTDKGRKFFAFGEDPVTYMLPIVLQMMGGPNAWAERDGKFVHAYETEEYKRALEVTARLWAMGVMHPQSIVDDTQIRAWFDSGLTMTYCWSMSGWALLAEAHPDWDIRLLDLPKWSGGAERARVFDGKSAFYAFNGISKQASEARVLEILEVLNFVSAPWGSQEYLDVSYGVKDHDYRLSNGQFTVLPPYKDDVKGWINYAGAQMGQALYSASNPALARYQYDYMKRTRPTVVKDAASGLYSETFQSKGATLNKKLFDTQYQIIQGNQPLASWDSMVKEWQSGVGNASRQEYAEARQVAG